MAWFICFPDNREKFRNHRDSPSIFLFVNQRSKVYLWKSNTCIESMLHYLIMKMSKCTYPSFTMGCKYLHWCSIISHWVLLILFELSNWESNLKARYNLQICFPLLLHMVSMPKNFTSRKLFIHHYCVLFEGVYGDMKNRRLQNALHSYDMSSYSLNYK